MQISTILPYISLIVGLIAVYKFYDDKRNRAIEEGQMRQTVAQLRKDIDAAYIKIHDIEKNASCAEIDLAEVRRDVKHILDALARIETKLSKD